LETWLPEGPSNGELAGCFMPAGGRFFTFTLSAYSRNAGLYEHSSDQGSQFQIFARRLRKQVTSDRIYLARSSIVLAAARTAAGLEAAESAR
jgi:hypothetical protein